MRKLFHRGGLPETVVAVLGGLALLCGNLQAAAPRLTNLLPHGIQRGTEARVTLYGTNLEDAEELLLYDEGLEVVSLTQPEDERQKGRQIVVTFKVAEHCSLGAQRMRIRTRTGLSDLQNIHVGALPVVDEKEPNTDFSEPQPLDLNVTVHGRIDSEDADYFVVSAKQGQRITVEVFGMRLGYSTGGNYFDPYVAILDEDRFELAVADDSPLLWNDPFVSIIAPRDGKYVIQIRDASYNGDGRAYYLAHIGTFPRPEAVMPAGGKPGETLTVTYLGDVSGPITREVTLPGKVPQRFGLEVGDDGGLAPSPQPFRLIDLDNSLEQEPNNDRSHASAGSAPGAMNGLISEPGDFDFFKFSTRKDQQFEVEVYARRIRSPLDPVLCVYRMDNGSQVAANDDSRGPDSYLRFKAPVDGEYAVAVRDHLNKGGPTYSYRIEMTPVTPALSAEPIEFVRYVQPQIIIPRGAGSGIVANISRRDIGGPVNFRSSELPAGVSIECPEGWRGDGTLPVIFFAAEDAPVAGRYSAVETYLADPNQQIEVAGPLMQNVLMIRGRNNNRVWEETITRLPVIVTEKAPFKVWIEPPPVPLVRGGSMQLVLHCERQEGWDEEIALRLLQDPPGVSSSGSVKFAKGQTEARVPMNASGNAAVRESMISARCTATVGNGPIELCTPFVPLSVQEQYVTFKFAQAAVQQGQEIPLVITVDQRKEFDGEAEVKLVGLPANTTADPVKMTKDSTELTFLVKTTESTPIGDNKNLLCQVLVPEAGTTITHNLGTGRLRVDKPAPPQQGAVEPKTKQAAKAKPPAKPLSRLEMLRQEQKEREAAQTSGPRQ